MTPPTLTEVASTLIADPRWEWQAGMLVGVCGDRFRLVEAIERGTWLGHREGGRSFVWTVPRPFYLAPGWQDDPGTLGGLLTLLWRHDPGALIRRDPERAPDAAAFTVGHGESVGWGRADGHTPAETAAWALLWCWRSP